MIDFSSSRGKELYLRTKAANVLQFRVSNVPVDDSSQLPAVLRPIQRIPGIRPLLEPARSHWPIIRTV